jgi:hypothetical protein
MNPTVIEILTEEASMEVFLRGLLPKLLPPDYAVDVNCFIRPHEGKSDLQKSIPNKLRAYPNFGYPVKVLIVHDQDSHDCVKLKEKLLQLCGASSGINVIVRIACRELENWYLGDLAAVEKAYPGKKIAQWQAKARFRAPDKLVGSSEMEKIVPDFSKVAAAREIAQQLDVDQNTSPSFRHFVSGLAKLIAQ